MHLADPMGFCKYTEAEKAAVGPSGEEGTDASGRRSARFNHLVLKFDLLGISGFVGDGDHGLVGPVWLN